VIFNNYLSEKKLYDNNTIAGKERVPWKLFKEYTFLEKWTIDILKNAFSTAALIASCS
jgi:hypothetical protein